MGKKMRACLSITQNNLYKWVLNPRIYLVAVLLGAYFHSRIFPILQFCDHYQVGISPFLFPFFLSDDHVVLIVTLGAMLLYGDAPFIDLEQPYIVLRAGRKTWVWGQILYLAVASFLYTIFTFLMTLLLLLPKLELQFDWGKVIGTLVQTTTGSEFGISIPFDRYVYFGYSPMGATGISLLLCFFRGAVFRGAYVLFESSRKPYGWNHCQRVVNLMAVGDSQDGYRVRSVVACIMDEAGAN